VSDKIPVLKVLVQYVGYKPKGLLREYTFNVREGSDDPREFTLTIPNEAFSAHRARYQDAPDICSLKLQRELVTYANHPPKTDFKVTDGELDDYRTAHTPKSARHVYTRKAQQEF
jgi:hypothetical protein